MKPQRIRDPLHDLIEFDISEFEQGLWNTLDSFEFQRLRRIKQLGFSELVYPGATHSRFLHSVGVFHTARQLLDLVRKKLGDSSYDNDRAKIALASALVHDVGHGPFSHAFETASKQLDKQRGKKSESRHETWTAEIIRGDTNLGKSLSNILGENGREEVAELLLQETPTDIYSAVVSSQFDADRLDYVRRDRLMTGAQHGGFDFSWLMANLEVEKVTFATDDEEYATSDMLILNHKAFQAAESYVLGLFHLYFTVYFHKATRAAEKMMTAIVVRIGELVDGGAVINSGLPEDHPLVQFVNHNSLENYLRLDDALVWGSLPLMTNAKDPEIAELANRLLVRDLYKSVDISPIVSASGSDALQPKFRARLGEFRSSGEVSEFDFFEDFPKRSPYKRRGFDSYEALSKVLIRSEHNGPYTDISQISSVVGALEEKTIYRVYARNNSVKEKIRQIVKEVAK